MTGTPGFVEFFVLEAGEYIEQLDGILLAAGADQPNAEELQRLARGLRGSATMAKLTSFAGLAAAIERVGRALREGELKWSQGLRGALVAAVDDLKTLLRSARSWSPQDDRRAGARVTELTVYAPPRTSGAFRAVGERTSGGSTSFLGNEASNIAAGLELLTTRPGDSATASNVLGRIRALRGVAEVKDAGPLADVLEATEDAAHGLDTGAAMSAESRRVLETATAYLRVLTPALRGSSALDAPGVARDEFSAAVGDWRARTTTDDRVVPISELFYEDGSPGVVERSEHPPTSASARFHLEMVSLSEHLNGVVDSARRAFEPEAIDRARREAIRAVRSLKASAESYGEHDTAARIADHLDAADRLGNEDLSALNSLADSLSTPGDGAERMTQTVRRSSSAETPSSTPKVAVPDNASAALLDSSIAALDQLTAAPMISPTPIPEDIIVPIETLLYRGRAALDRAVEVRDELRRIGATSDPLALEELFDLVELARAD
ncbi:MAG: Hpt domain-containing protein [Gemmatimonadaceae bacterium]